jgi:hypothetical protein
MPSIKRKCCCAPPCVGPAPVSWTITLELDWDTTGSPWLEMYVNLGTAGSPAASATVGCIPVAGWTGNQPYIQCNPTSDGSSPPQVYSASFTRSYPSIPPNPPGTQFSEQYWPFYAQPNNAGGTPPTSPCGPERTPTTNRVTITNTGTATIFVNGDAVQSGESWVADDVIAYAGYNLHSHAFYCSSAYGVPPNLVEVKYGCPA